MRRRKTLPRASGRCGSCDQIVSFAVDEHGKGVLPPHGPKRSCPWIGKEVQGETREMQHAREEARKAEKEARCVEEAARDANSWIAAELMAAVMLPMVPFPLSDAPSSRIEKPQGRRRFPVPK